MEEFKHKVKELRHKMNWTQEDLARSMYISLSTVQRWESKGAKPSRLASRELRKLFQKAKIDGTKMIS